MSEIRFLKKLETTPKKDTKVYTLKTPSFSQRGLVQMLKVLKTKGETEKGRFEIDEKRMTYTEGPNVVTLHRKSGALKYYDSTRWQVDDGKSNVDLSDTNAIEKAKNYIRKT